MVKRFFNPEFYEEVEFIDADSATTVKAGNTETVTVTPPAGYVYEILGLKMTVVKPGGTSTGDHGFTVGDETNNLGLGNFKSVHGSNCEFDHGMAIIADDTQRPPANTDQMLSYKHTRFDENTGININYLNNTDADQANARTIKLIVRKIKVA